MNVACRLSDLNTREMEAEALKIECDHQNVYTNKERYAIRYRDWNQPDEDPDGWSRGSRSGDGSTVICDL